MLPVREAECAIKALHSSSGGFRLLGMFLIFYALYFALVFTGFDIAFERAVEQGLRSHVDSVGEDCFTGVLVVITPLSQILSRSTL